VDDAAYGFVGALERDRCIGQAYNLVREGYVQFDQYHRTAMEIIGKEVPMVGLPLDTLLAIDPKRFKIAGDEFSFNIYCAWEKVYRDIPEFRPKISLKEGMTRVLEALDRDGRIPNSDTMRWEDDLIAMAQAIREYRITV
jgi:nucleoside-diphosphate-sugar epimerase